MSEHKHAEVLRAIADGKEVEYFNKNDEVWQEMSFITPLTYPEFTWRIKPKPPIVNSTHIHLNEEVNWWSYNDLQTPNVRFTFDPDTKLPIKVELI